MTGWYFIRLLYLAKDNFSLPDDLLINRKYKTFCRVAQWAAERAKIELSAMDTATIALSEGESRSTDEEGNELYIDIDITRADVDALIADLVAETIFCYKRDFVQSRTFIK